MRAAAKQQSAARRATTGTKKNRYMGGGGGSFFVRYCSGTNTEYSNNNHSTRDLSTIYRLHNRLQFTVTVQQPSSVLWY